MIGPNADQVQFGDYCWSKSNRDGMTVLRGLRERLGDGVKLNYAKGCDLAGRSTDGFAAAVEAARQSDVADRRPRRYQHDSRAAWAGKTRRCRPPARWAKATT